MSHLKSCHCCGLVQSAPDGLRAACSRCATRLGSWLGEGAGNRLAAAFAAAALIVYLPAMWLPFLRIERLGQAHASSLLGGVRTLFAEGHLLVGFVVLAFSIVFPVLKLSALLVLSQNRWRLAHRNRALVYRWVEHLGRWGMLDVLLVAVMVAFVKLGGLVQFSAGPGLVTFAVFVLLSLCASAVFDPYALWDEGLTLAVGTPTGGQVPPPTNPTAVVTTETVPQAVAPTPSGKRWWVWLIPVAALLVVGGLIWNVFAHRGRIITLTFREGHGIAAGAELRYHGIVCGEVELVRLSPDLAQVELSIRLTPEADGLARDGSRFWIVRPQADLTGIAGLETVVGAKYVTVLPGDVRGPLVRAFTGLNEPPVPDLEEPGGIEIVLQSPRSAGLRSGVGVYYRDMRIGGVVSTQLAGDGSAIETRAYIRPRFLHLVRQNAVFWNASGVHLHGGLTDFNLHIGTAETLLQGGVALSLPPEPGELVESGHRFVLHPRPQAEWLDWQPPLASHAAPPLARWPPMLAAKLTWTHDGLLLNRPQERRGWLLRTPQGVAGPVDLLSAPNGALNSEAILEFDGVSHALAATEPVADGGVLLELELPTAETTAATVPASNPSARVASAPEDVWLVTDRESPPLFVAAVRCHAEGDRWRIDDTLPVSMELHGAAALASSDGALLGRLLCVDGERWIVPHSPRK